MPSHKRQGNQDACYDKGTVKREQMYMRISEIFHKNFFCKEQILYIFGFANHAFFVTTTQFCHRSVKATIDNTWMNDLGCVPITIPIQKQALGQISSVDHSLLIRKPEL